MRSRRTNFATLRMKRTFASPSGGVAWKGTPKLRNPGGEHRRPEVAPVMAMDDLDAFAADQLCHAQNEAHLRQPFRRSRMERHPQTPHHARELPSIRAGQPHLLTQLAQAIRSEE